MAALAWLAFAALAAAILSGKAWLVRRYCAPGADDPIPCWHEGR